MLKKIFLTFFILFILAVLGLSLYAKQFIVFDEKTNSVFFRLDPEEKTVVKKIAKFIAGIIYREATIRNPEGDILPDELDDEIIKGIKDRVK